MHILVGHIICHLIELEFRNSRWCKARKCN
jgi:hypothetical protein